MARQLPKWEPGTAANIFVRSVLSEAGTLLGGLSEAQWDETVAFFGGCCAYTGEPLVEGQVDGDHAIPMNRVHVGLHLFGNVFPTSKAVNQAKGATHYREFVKDRARLARIEEFRKLTGYDERVAVFGDLKVFCATHYDNIDAQARACREQLRRRLPEPTMPNTFAPGREDRAESTRSHRRSAGPGATLPIELDPQPETAFKAALLQARKAWITIEYRDGRREVSPWDARNFSRTSHVTGNLRSRPQFRSGAWQAAGISRIRVTIRRPSDA